LRVDELFDGGAPPVVVSLSLCCIFYCCRLPHFHWLRRGTVAVWRVVARIERVRHPRAVETVNFSKHIESCSDYADYLTIHWVFI